MISGGTPLIANDENFASGVRLNCFRMRSDTRISAPAPSDICELVAAVTRALGGEHRLQLGQRFERRVRARTFVQADGLVAR
jgi:hypothetical protein